jgi:hypothetical protein
MAAFNQGGTVNGNPGLTLDYGGGLTKGDAAPGIEQWGQFFGAPARPIDANPYDNYSQSTLQMPEAYKGNNGYLTTIVMRMILDEDEWPWRVALPFKIDESRIEIQWDEIHFNNHMLNPVPEEGTSRLVSQTVSERRDHTIRYGLALMLEHGFMRTERGRLSYAMNLKQIKNAVLETVYHSVVEAYLRCKTYNQVWTARYGRGMTPDVLRIAVQNEVEEFGLIQKVEHGFDLLDSRLKRIMRSKQGVSPDMWILSEGTKVFLTNVRKENFNYYVAGPAGALTYASGLNGGASKAVDVKNDCQIFEAKSVEIPGEMEPVNLLARNRTIGEFYPMVPHTDVSSGYATRHRAVSIYDANKDGFVKISLEAAIENCPRFSDDSGMLDFHDVPPDSVPNDPFVYRTTTGAFRPVLHFGDFSKDALKDRTAREFARTALQVFDDRRHSDLKQALEDGIRLIRTLEEPTPGSAQTAYFNWMKTEYGNDVSPTKDPTTKLIELPLSDKPNVMFTDGVANFVPSGYSTFAGLQVLAKPITASPPCVTAPSSAALPTNRPTSWSKTVATRWSPTCSGCHSRLSS